MGIFDDEDGSVAKINLYNDDVVNVEEFHSSYRSRQLSPEKQLLLAVLKHAVWCATKSRSEDLKKEARKWFLSEDESDLFTFNQVCRVLSIEPSWFRKALKQRFDSTVRRSRPHSIASAR